jgi:peptidoglycan/LPS O-acetylase OafA/YrhL
MHSSDHPNNNFDFVRVVAALFVIYSHQYALTGLPEPSVLGVHSLGGLGVMLFFTLSGYLVSTSWNADPNVPRFIVRRFLRIWPALAVVVLLTAFVLGPAITTLSLHDYFSHPLVWGYLNNLRFVLHDQLASVFVGNSVRPNINGSLWTIPLEVKCYAMLALLGVCGVLAKRWLVTTLVLTFVFLYAVVEARGESLVEALNWRHDQRISLEFTMFFLTGAMIQRYDITSNVRGRQWAWVLCLIGAELAFALQRPMLALWLAVPAAALLFGTASTPYVRQTGRFGDFSYGLYLYAMPIQQTLLLLYKDRLSWSTILVLAMLVTLCLAAASWHLVEERALRLKPAKSTDVRIPAVATVGLLGYVLLT